MGVSYHGPMVGPKFYTARGTSGWVEAFPRDLADRDLQTVLGSISIVIAVDGFRAQRKLGGKRPIDWTWIIEYLASLTKTSSSLITDGAAVSFWCHIILAERDEFERKVN